MSASTIAKLNDLFRQTFLTGRVILTDGIRALNDDDREAIITQVRGFTDFSEDNDPHGEHDFGAFDHPDVGKVFWKIDYYDPTMQFASENAADPAQTHRVLTIMLAEEY